MTSWSAAAQQMQFNQVASFRTTKEYLASVLYRNVLLVSREKVICSSSGNIGSLITTYQSDVTSQQPSKGRQTCCSPSIDNFRALDYLVDLIRIQGLFFNQFR